ncbi:hypothetical protein [Heliorestis convoluta]|uniref:Uncharacterized protein n=1 Tax=Heliorestis convoluta TaxID=356322 RepID=A0A5Q2N0N6_9FIRM|nr:hypothetical protein [Heliorestis convoluta]QGG46832.1 hypothetical protein FTV88_0654 [Heliorestis convoluta]
MLIGVDICNTIAKINEALALRFLGTSEIPQELRKQRRWDLPGLNPDFFRTHEGLRLFFEAKPYEGAAETLNKLVSAGHRVVYITAKPKESELVTRRG